MKEVLVRRSKFIIALLIIVIVSAASVGVVLAYYTSKTNTAVNTFTIATLTSEINETFEQTGETTFTKEISIENTSNKECLIRARIVVSPEEQLENILIDGVDGTDWEPEVSSNWEYNELDGYYYYTEAVAAGGSTNNLMNTVEIIDLEELEDFQIIVYQEAIQTSVFGTDVFYGTTDLFGNDNAITLETDGYQAVWDAYDLCIK